MSRLRIDLETRSVIDLRARGVYNYAQHPSTDVLLASYKIDDGPLQRWKRGQPCPDDIRQHVESGGEIIAFNAGFERLMWWNVLTPKHGWPKPGMRQFRCTAVTAAAMSLPRDLDRLGDALGLDVRKDKNGRKLMKIHSIPTGFNADGSPIWHKLADDPSSLEQYHSYCDFDVLTEEAAERRLIPLSDAEMKVYWLNETINDRGLRIDRQSAIAAIALTDKAKQAINREITAVTGGYVTAVTQTAKMLEWIGNQGVKMPSLAKDDVDEFLHEVDDLPERVVRVLELRQEGAKPSVEKIHAMLQRASDDGRGRGVYLHHGAGQTGRFSSRDIQAHNMPKYRKVFEKELETGKLDINTLFEVIRSGDPDFLRFMYGDELGRPLHLLSDAVRSFIWADPGCEIVDADYSSIEGRMAAWFAGEEWKVDAFRALDRGEGHGIYELAAAGIYGVPVESVTKAQRPTGKVAELSCQYQTGVGGIRKFARQNKVKLPGLYETLWDAAEPEQRSYVDKRFNERVAAHDDNTTVLGREGWIAAELIKVGWRAKHPMIVKAWSDLETAATEAVANPGTVTSLFGGRVSYIVRHGFLWCRLPSGRCLAYGSPKMKELEAPWADKTLEPAKREKKLSLTARGTDAQTGRWERFPIYGGSLFNNVVQGSARDILVNGMEKAETAGLPIVLHTHDELAIEVPRGAVAVKDFEQLICDLPAWAAGLPLTADGWASKRYHK
ncbi:MAG: hypothetical protein EOQ31_31495 [Mesorhizobium sp.]|uniref:DNA polymerase n=1 Tax=Mesorhizobium sp. TaxID=1871066 RepID=UPI000FE76AFF|nr:DNA polymerase [Mesorhizobium sp.]RWA81472.1 MAG: hypothetical protein EOQ31_31495 [Mesorhizobium sp.]